MMRRFFWRVGSGLRLVDQAALSVPVVLAIRELSAISYCPAVSTATARPRRWVACR